MSKVVVEEISKCPSKETYWYTSENIPSLSPCTIHVQGCKQSMGIKNKGSV